MTDIAAPTTLATLFWDSVAAHKEDTAQTWCEGETWHSRSYEAFGDAVAATANGLLDLGVRKGERVCVWSKNSPMWAEVDFANQTIGAATVPIYDTLTGDQAAYIIKDADAKVLFVQDVGMYKRIKEHLPSTSVKQVILFVGSSKDLATYRKFQSGGKAFAKANPDKMQSRMQKVAPDDLASLVYTSGTTGNPKGVMLSQNNFASNALVAQTCVDIGPTDKFLSFLPLSHVFERTGGHFTPFSVGAEVVYARGIETLVEDMAIHKPTLMMSVPRLYEKIYTRILDAINGGSFVKKRIFNWAMAQGRAANVYVQRNEPLPKSLQKKVNLANKLVFGKLQEKVGGKLRYFISGGAALSQTIEEFFWAAGIQILQGYGLTETSPVVTVNRPGALRFGSCGKAVPGAELKIDPEGWHSARTDVIEGEICMRGPMIMQGYFNDAAATKEVMDGDYFRSGDVGFIDDDGFLFITDRKKEIIVMSNGKNVAPQPIEGKLKLQPHIAQACVIGDNRKYMSALICPDFEALETFASANGIAAEGAQLVSDQRVVSLIEQQVEAVNQELSRYEQIKKFWIVTDDWTVETGELTPTLKLKRRIIGEKFHDHIDELYPTN